MQACASINSWWQRMTRVRARANVGHKCSFADASNDDGSAPSSASVDSHWTIGHFLPNAHTIDSSIAVTVDCQRHFETLVAGYVMYAYEQMQLVVRNGAAEKENEQPMDDEDDDDEQASMSKDALVNAVNLRCRRLIGGEMTQKFMEIVQTVHHKVSG
jgi:hypothetical protein